MELSAPARAAWVPDPDGRVVQIVGVSPGLAELDVDGDGVADPAASAAALGISDDERAWLASRYPLGSELWHTEIHHFSTIDLNNMKGCPECEGPPRLPIAGDDTCTAEEQVASVIECTNQTFGEDVPVAGTRAAAETPSRARSRLCTSSR